MGDGLQIKARGDFGSGRGGSKVILCKIEEYVIE